MENTKGNNKYGLLALMCLLGGLLFAGNSTAQPTTVTDAEYITREIEPLEMAEWFVHDRWPTQFLDGKWWIDDSRKLEFQPGFQWLVPAYDSLQALLDSLDLANYAGAGSVFIIMARLNLVKSCEPYDKLLIALHAQQVGRLSLLEEWQLYWTLGRLYTQKEDAELSLYYLIRSSEVAKEYGSHFAIMQSEFALYQRAELLDKRQEWEHYRNYLKARDMVRARWLKNQLNHDLAIGPPDLSESLAIQKALLVPGSSRNKLKWWPALVLLMVVGSSWLVYNRQQYLGQLLFKAPGIDKLLQLKQEFSSQQQAAEADVSDPEEEIPVDEGKLDQLSALHLMKLLTEEDWNLFLLAFDEIYPGFHWRLRLKVNDISPAELRLMCLIRLHLNSREISRRLGISQQSVNIARYRLRRKLGLEHHERLEEFVLTL